ncbi:MAG: hypothetical protein KAJ58_01310 [Candidatus Pacebacteria bacterium]|nr:hypothetical protein [Candidatus Paceibacterota bacterium]
MKKIQIIPAILAKNSEDLEDKLSLLKEAYQILDSREKMMVQIDICNDNFFENIDFSVIEKYADIFNFELDLMNINIVEITERLNELSHSAFDRIIFHYEDWQENFEIVIPLNEEGISSRFSFEIGLALIPNTPIEKLNPYLENLDFIQFMGIDSVGVQGGSFNPAVIEKIKEFRKQNTEMVISVDGGVNLENAQDLIGAGINRFAAGLAIFGENNLSHQQTSPAQQVAENIEKLNSLS